MAAGAPIYSTRFLAFASSGVWVYFTVPAGYRAVLKMISAFSTNAAATGMQCTVGGFTVFWASFPGGAFRSVNQPLMAVAYPGETIGGFHSGSGMESHLDGYLLHDSVGRQDFETDGVEEPSVPPPEWAQMTIDDFIS